MFRVAIVGRPNVGKSTLFNTLIGEKKAIVERTPGITRDFITGFAEIEDGKGVEVIDTGGIDWGSEDFFSTRIQEIVKKILDIADLVLFVVDAKEGLTAGDEDIARFLRESGKKVLLVVNKVESFEDEEQAREFFALGFEETVFISAKNRKNIHLLREKIREIAGDNLEEEKERHVIRVAILGRPNVGKSTLLNRLIGQERVIVSEIPGTTRDCVDVLLERNDGLPLVFIDTPGIRRRARIEERAEKFSVDKALETLRKIDVALFLVTAEEGLTHQDKTLLRQIDKHYKACLLLVNKWDLFEDKPQKGKIFLELLRHHLKFMSWLPIEVISSLKGTNIEKIIPLVDEIYAEYRKRVPTSRVNELLEDLKRQYSFNIKGKRLKFYYATQVDIAPPTFVIFINVDPEEIPRHVEKFFRRKFQETLGFEKVPVRVIFRLRD